MHLSNSPSFTCAPQDGDDGSDTGTSTTNSDISALSASSKSSPAIDLESLSRKDDRLCRLIQQAQDQRRLANRSPSTSASSCECKPSKPAFTPTPTLGASSPGIADVVARVKGLRVASRDSDTSSDAQTKGATSKPKAGLPTNRALLPDFVSFLYM